MIELPKFKSIEEAEEYAKGLFMRCAAAESTVKELEEKLSHSEKLLKVPPKDIDEQDEQLEQLLMREINSLDTMSRLGGLDNEDTKRLKMLVDSLVSLRKQAQGVIDKKEKTDSKKKSQKRLSTNDLMTIVKGGKK
jgi:hypothetical protein